MDTLPPKPGPDPTQSNDVENRRARRRREKKDSKERQQPEASGSTTPLDTMNTNSSELATFEKGQDFIPFEFSELSEEEPDHVGLRGNGKRFENSSPPGKGKGKERVKEGLSDTDERGGVKPTSPGQTPPGGRGNGYDRTAARERSNERRSGRGREWDRGKDGYEDRRRDRDGDRIRGTDNDEERDRNRSGNKRKYEMVFDPNDGYSNKKQRTDASSRKAPWLTGLDMGHCNNVAELYVSHRVPGVF